MTEQEMQDRLLNNLILPVWRGADEGMKIRYARNIWEQFAEGVRAACYSPDLAAFYSKLQQRFEVVLRAADTALVAGVINSPDAKNLFNYLRRSGTVDILCLRAQLANQERKEALKKAREEAQTGEATTEQLPF